MTREKIKALIPISIDGVCHEVQPDITLYQACEAAGIEIPIFCYHPKLSIAGNCRMCLVEVKGSNKLVASCAFPVTAKMEVTTASERVQAARKGVLEFLLINHPLDCPICDQGGECDLQDLAMAYGPGASRFEEPKRAMGFKNFGPLIKAEMTRCIHCMRCVRFGKEIAGLRELGTLHRGEDAEVTTVLGAMITSELSGNMIDICPVGALTGKPYAFHGRAWEFQTTDGIDVHDGVGSNIRIDTRGEQVMRILPRVREDLNEEWISDKVRFACDGLKRQRLDHPYVRAEGGLVPAPWQAAFGAIKGGLSGLKPEEIGVIVGDLSEAESMFALKDLMGKLGVTNIDCRQGPEFLPLQQRGDYLFNTSVAGLELADVCLIVGSDPRYEAPMVNVRIRKAYLERDCKVLTVGPQVDLTYPYEHVGSGFESLETLLHQGHPAFRGAKNPVMIVGASLLRHAKGKDLYGLARSVADKYGLKFNVLSLTAHKVGALDLGFYPKKGSVYELLQQKKLKALFLLGADDIEAPLLEDVFVIYQGSHGDRGVYSADVVLPGAAYPEKEGTYVNTEGRVQRSFRALAPVGDALEDWRIIHGLAAHLGHPLSYGSLDDLRKALETAHPTFKTLDRVTPEPLGVYSFTEGGFGGEIVYPITNFYGTDVISRSSETMARCNDAFRKATK